MGVPVTLSRVEASAGLAMLLLLAIPGGAVFTWMAVTHWVDQTGLTVSLILLSAAVVQAALTVGLWLYKRRLARRGGNDITGNIEMSSLSKRT